MSLSTITVEATLLPDGVTLQLEEKIPLPPGKVTLTMQLAQSKPGATMLEVLDRIRQDQQQRGRQMTTEEEMEDAIAQMRSEDDEYEERWEEIWSRTRKQDEKTDERR